jgi:soluble lytic murein transglycosylase-like protein
MAMSISRINISPVNKALAVVQATDHGAQTNRLSFKEMLYKTTSEAPGASIENLSPLSKTQLMDILNNVRMQMNSRLIHALSSDIGKEIDTRYTGLLDRLIMPSTESSKEYRSNQNNDVFRVREDLDLTINQAAKAHGVDPALVKSVIKVESNFNPASTSPKGAMGLMQLMPCTARDLGVHNAYDPIENIWAGTRYLKTLLSRYGGDIRLALAAYNWGMGNLEKRPGQMPAETKSYIEKVTGYYEQATA